MADDIKFCRHILRRSPPCDVSDNLQRLIALRVDLDEESYRIVDIPFGLVLFNLLYLFDCMQVKCNMNVVLIENNAGT